MREIKTKNGKTALVDDEDFERVNSFRWFFVRSSTGRGSGYFATGRGRNGKKMVYLHHAIIGRPVNRKMSVDHVNGNGLDNRKENLRFATARQQRQNSAIRMNNHSGFKGISKRKQCETFKAEIMAKGRRIYLGDFKTELEAFEAYKKAAIQHYQEFARV